MSRRPIELLVAVGSKLVRLPKPIAFVGGATTGLHVTDPAAPAPRATLDVDIIVSVNGVAEYATVIAPALRTLGASEDDSEGAPLCRWVLDGVIVDVMPTDARVLGFANRWYESALSSAIDHMLPDETIIRVVDPPHFLATKIEAFIGRGAGDFMASKDIEDIVAVVDGRMELIDEIRAADPRLRSFLAETFEAWLRDFDLRDSLPGHLPGNMDNYGRAEVVVERLQRIVSFRFDRDQDRASYVSARYSPRRPWAIPYDHRWTPRVSGTASNTSVTSLPAAASSSTTSGKRSNMLVDDLALAAHERRAFDTRMIWRQLLESEGAVAALPPPVAASPTLRAIAASLVELLALRRGEPAPEWAKAVLPLDEPFLLVTVTSQAKLARLARESPMPLLKRRLLAPEGFLTVA